MLCVVIKGPSIDEAKTQIQEALAYADLVELRLDYFDSLTIEKLKELMAQFSLPMIFTLRTSQQGGDFKGSLQDWISVYHQLISLNPAYLDVEYNDFTYEIASLVSNSTSLIVSYHDFEKVPEDLDALYHILKKIKASHYKIAVKTFSTLEALKILNWKRLKNDVILIGMGEEGQITRILAPIVGSPITYARLETDENNLGQLSAKELSQVYHHSFLTNETSLYGLIGDPVAQSIGDLFHNHYYESSKRNAVYIKMKVAKEELDEFIKLTKLLKFKGLSVTRPLKEQILLHLDQIDGEASNIGAVNTLVFNDQKIKGYNTDGSGAVLAMEKHFSLHNKIILVLGSGGTSKAIAYAARQKRAQVKVVSRHPNKGQLSYDELISTQYDVLINATPSTNPLPDFIFIPNKWVFEVNIKPTLFLLEAIKQGCPTLSGHDLFTYQALAQLDLWFPTKRNCDT